MQDHAILSDGMDTLVDTVEPLLGRRPELQVDITGKAPQGTVHGHAALGFQFLSQFSHLVRT